MFFFGRSDFVLVQSFLPYSCKILAVLEKVVKGLHNTFSSLLSFHDTELSFHGFSLYIPPISDEKNNKKKMQVRSQETMPQKRRRS